MQVPIPTGHSSTSGCPPTPATPSTCWPRGEPGKAPGSLSHPSTASHRGRSSCPRRAMLLQPPRARQNCALTHLVDPELAHDDVVHRGGDFPPDIVIPTGVELQVDGACGDRNDLRNVPQSSPPTQHCAHPQGHLSPCIPHSQVWLWIHPSLSLLQEGREKSCQALCSLPQVLTLKAGQKCAAWLIQALAPLWECCPAQGQAKGK